MFRTIARTEKNKRTAAAVPALLLSVVVLIMAIAGTATAAKLITGKDIANGTVSSKDVKDGSLGEKDLKGKVKAKLNAPAVSGYEVVSETTLIGSGSQDTAFAPCSAGKVVVSAGYTWSNDQQDNAVYSSVPQKVIRGDALLYAPADPGFADGWKLEVENFGLDPQDLTLTVICVDPS